MAESNSHVAAKRLENLSAEPINYGMNHVHWDRPNENLAWTKLRLVGKLGGYPKTEVDGVSLLEDTSNNLFVVPASTVSTVNTFNFSYGGTTTAGTVDSTYNGGSVIVGSTTTTRIAAFSSRSGGGAVDLPISTYGALDTVSLPTDYFNNPITTTTPTTVSASPTGGSGTGAILTLTYSAYTYTSSSPSSVYPVQGGIAGSAFTATAVSLNPPTSGSTTLTSVTSTAVTGSGQYATFNVTVNSNSTFVITPSSAGTTNNGTKYAVGDTLTITCSLGTFSITVNGIYVLKLTSIVPSSRGSGYIVGDSLSYSARTSGRTLTSTVTAIYNIPAAKTYLYVGATGGSGTGAAVTVQRSGLSNPCSVTSVVAMFQGTGYQVGDVLTVAADDIGGSANGALPLTLVVGSVNTITNTGSATVTYGPVTSTTLSGGGSGATFYVTRTGPAGSSVPVTGITVASPGSGYSSTSVVSIADTVIGSSGTNLQLTTGTPGTGAAGQISSVVYGTAIKTNSTSPSYTAPAYWANVDVATGGTLASQANETYTSVPLLTVTGSGTGALATITRDGSGNISGVTILSSGADYAVNDLLVVPGAYIGDPVVQTTDLGVTTEYHLYDNGQKFIDNAYVPDTTRPDPVTNYERAVGTFHQGKEVFYSVFAQYLDDTAHSISGTPTNPWTRLANTYTVSVEDTGMFAWLKSHLPSMYFSSINNAANEPLYGGAVVDPNKSDLDMFLSLFAFYLEKIKTTTKLVFNRTRAHESPALSVLQYLNQLGIKFSDIQDVAQARTVMKRAINMALHRGSVSGLKDTIKSYTGYEVSSVSLSPNLLHGFNTSSFEQDLGQWRAGISATYGLGYSTTAPYLNLMTGISAVGTTVVPYTNGSNSAAGIAQITGNSATATTASWFIGPAKSVVISTAAAGTTQVTVSGLGDTSLSSGGFYSGFHLIETPSTVVPGTKITSLNSSTGVLTLDTPLAGSLAAGTEVWTSPNAIDKAGALAAYQSVNPGFPYSFSIYVNRGTSTAVTFTTGIVWRDLAGNVVSTSTNTLSTTAQASTNTWYRGHVTGEAPGSAYFAEPYVSASLSNAYNYYLDAASLSEGMKISSVSRSGGSFNAVYTVTADSAGNHGFTAGNKVTIVGLSNSTLNGTFTISSVTTTTFTVTTGSNISTSVTNVVGAYAASPRVFKDARTVTYAVDGKDYLYNSTSTVKSLSGNSEYGTTKTSLLNKVLAESLISGYSITTTGTDNTKNITTSTSTVSVSTVTYDALYYYVTYKALASSVATLTLSAPHDLQVGDSVTVAGVDAVFNGSHTLTAVSTYGISFSSTSTSTVTPTVVSDTAAKVTSPYTLNRNPVTSYEIKYTTTTEHNLVPGQQVSVVGISPSAYSVTKSRVNTIYSPYTFSVRSLDSVLSTSPTPTGNGVVYIDRGRAGQNVVNVTIA